MLARINVRRAVLRALSKYVLPAAAGDGLLGVVEEEARA